MIKKTPCRKPYLRPIYPLSVGGGLTIRNSLVVRIGLFHSLDPGSIPGFGI